MEERLFYAMSMTKDDLLVQEMGTTLPHVFSAGNVTLGTSKEEIRCTVIGEMLSSKNVFEEQQSMPFGREKTLP
jgi:hypothetical protein